MNCEIVIFKFVFVRFESSSWLWIQSLFDIFFKFFYSSACQSACSKTLCCERFWFAAFNSNVIWCMGAFMVIKNLSTLSQNRGLKYILLSKFILYRILRKLSGGSLGWIQRIGLYLTTISKILSRFCMNVFFIQSTWNYIWDTFLGTFIVF